MKIGSEKGAFFGGLEKEGKRGEDGCYEESRQRRKVWQGKFLKVCPKKWGEDVGLWGEKREFRFLVENCCKSDLAVFLNACNCTPYGVRAKEIRAHETSARGENFA